jgi:DNA adenine methylase
MRSFWRYPGGKAKLHKVIVQKLMDISLGRNEYREPFVGGAGIGLKYLSTNPNIKKIWLNDKDAGVASIWTALVRDPQKFKQHIRGFRPSIAAFDEFKAELLATTEMPEGDAEIALLGFKKLAIHQISYSGLGTKSGGPLGGREQKSKYKIDCRWSPDYICAKIDYLHDFFARFEIHGDGCTSLDFSVLLKKDAGAVIYLDPPYYVKGGDLYQHSFLDQDHQRLAQSLMNSQSAWLLSYDSCDEIRELYRWAHIDDTMHVKCTINGVKQEVGARKILTKPEFLISNQP